MSKNPSIFGRGHAFAAHYQDMKQRLSYLDQPRDPRGQWMESRHGSSGLSLPAREDLLASGGDVQGTVLWTSLPAKTTARIDDWWQGAFNSGDYHHSGNVPRMPDDNTPQMKSGRSLTGSRRTYRRRYEVAGATFRMPSRTAINRFLDTEGLSTVDVPVSMSTGNHNVQTVVRLTRNTVGQFEASTRGADGNLDLRIAESASAIMEKRQAEVSSINDLFVRRDVRRSLYGVRADTPVRDNSFISSIGYENGRLTIAMKDKAYRYEVSEEVYRLIQSTWAPGKTYNSVVKGESPSQKLTRCNSCGRFAGNGHICPVTSKRQYAASTFVQHIAARKRESSLTTGGMRPDVTEWTKPTSQGTGWTRQAVSSVLYDLSTKEANPDAYRSQTNGTDGTLRFDGLRGNDAAKVASLMSDEDCQTYRWMLNASQNPRLSLGGAVHAPTRGEGITFTSVSFNDPQTVERLRSRGAAWGNSSIWQDLSASYGLPQNQVPKFVSINAKGEAEAVF